MMTMRDIVRCTAGVCNVSRDALLGRRRVLSVVRPRHVAMYLCRELLSKSYPEIGRFFAVDHTTILHAHRSVAASIEDGDKALIERVEAVKALLADKPIEPFLPTPRADLIREIRAAIALASAKLAELEGAP